MSNQENITKPKFLNAPHLSFIYFNHENKLCITEDDWIDPVPFNMCCPIDSSGNKARDLLYKIIEVAKETDCNTLTKQDISNKTRTLFPAVAYLNKSLDYLNELDYIYLTQGGGVSGRKQLIILNPKSPSILEARIQ